MRYQNHAFGPVQSNAVRPSLNVWSGSVWTNNNRASLIDIDKVSSLSKSFAEQRLTARDSVICAFSKKEPQIVKPPSASVPVKQIVKTTHGKRSRQENIRAQGMGGHISSY